MTYILRWINISVWANYSFRFFNRQMIVTFVSHLEKVFINLSGTDHENQPVDNEHLLNGLLRKKSNFSINNLLTLAWNSVKILHLFLACCEVGRSSCTWFPFKISRKQVLSMQTISLINHWLVRAWLCFQRRFVESIRENLPSYDL